MRICHINTCDNGSTGKIARGIISQNCRETDYLFVGKKTTLLNNVIKIQNKIGNIFHRLISGLFDWDTSGSKYATHKLIKQLKKLKPDIVHLHNLHGYYVNYPMLFNYLKKNKIKTIWTLHDCWSFTGHCAHFIYMCCDKWIEGCYKCPNLSSYPRSLFFDRSKQLYKLKKRLYADMEGLTIVTPSKWLHDLASRSFLRKHNILTINNGIDLNIFKPIENNFREKYNLNKAFIVLGVAFEWGHRKGLDVFINLADNLDENYQIVLVGTDAEIDRQLPANVISIHKTNNQQELAEIYSAADVFVNPTREDNFPTVNIEALACGIPVITFDTGGSPEIADETCGIVVPCDDVDSLKDNIKYIRNFKPFSSEQCRKRAEKFDMSDKFMEYINLYSEKLEVN